MAKRSSKEVVNATEISAMYSLISGFVGKTCWRANLSWGGELHLHFGRQVEYPIPQLKNEKQGEWMFCTSISEWIVSVPKRRKITSNETNQQRLEEKLHVLQGVELRTFDVTAMKTSLTFGNGCQLCIFHSQERGDRDDACWELFMPGHMYLTFDPRNRWSYRRSDVPESVK